VDDVSVDTRVCAASTLMNPERVVDDAEPVAYSIDELVPSLTCAGVLRWCRPGFRCQGQRV